MDYGIVKARNLEGRIWQDPYGPTHTYFLSVEGGIPQRCGKADYDCVRVLAGKIGVQEISAQKLSNVQFGIQVLGFKMPWAWNEYLKNRPRNDKAYNKYVKKTNSDYLKGFLSRYGLSGCSM